MIPQLGPDWTWLGYPWGIGLLLACFAFGLLVIWIVTQMVGGDEE